MKRDHYVTLCLVYEHERRCSLIQLVCEYESRYSLIQLQELKKQQELFLKLDSKGKEISFLSSKKLTMIVKPSEKEKFKKEIYLSLEQMMITEI